MAMTMTEKILARAAGKESVAPGDLIMAQARPLPRQRRHRRRGHRRVREGRVRTRCSTRRRSPSSPTTSRRTRTSSPPGWSSRCASSRASTGSSTTTRWAAWAWSTPSCPSRGWSVRATWSSAPTPTPAPTAPWARSPPGSAPPTWPAPWPPGEAWFRVPETHLFDFDGTLGRYVTGQRHRPFHHRPDRGGRRPLQGHGVRRFGHPQPLHGRALHHLQHGHRGGRQERHHRARRHHQGLRRGPVPGHAAVLHLGPRRRVREDLPLEGGRRSRSWWPSRTCPRTPSRRRS